MSIDEQIEQATQEFIADSQILLEVDEEFVREIFAAGARWMLNRMKAPMPERVQ